MKNHLRRDARQGERGSSGRTIMLSPPDGAAAKGAVKTAARDGGSSPAAVAERRTTLRKNARVAAKARVRRAARPMSAEKVIRESQRWLDVIARHDRLTPAQKKRVVKDTVRSFDTYFNSGFPYAGDQWISAWATGWAAMALAQ